MDSDIIAKAIMIYITVIAVIFMSVGAGALYLLQWVFS